ncbi:MAG: hypothetical protein PVSMB2_29530 [Ktedonobacteraceae bacterium]
MTPITSSLSTTSAKTAISRQTGKYQTQGTSKRASLVYVTVAFLVIVLFSFAGLRAAGISLSSLTIHTHSGNGLLKESYPIGNGTPLFLDKFADDGSGWNLQSVPGNYAVTVGNGALSLESDKQNLLWEPLPGTRTFTNFQLVANATLSKGDQNNGYGFYIRGAANQGNELATYYRFELYGDGSYAIFKGSTDATGKTVDTKLVNFLLNRAIAKKGKSNQIRIIARGSKLSFIVNNHLLQTVKDNSYSSGSIALFVSNLPEAKPGAQAQFSQLSIYPI